MKTSQLKVFSKADFSCLLDELGVFPSLADYGMRKYDKAAGRFITPDGLWEKYYAWSPYHYSGKF